MPTTTPASSSGPGGVYETTTQLTPKSRGDIREIAELTSDDELLAVAQLPEVPVSLEHLRHVDPHTRIVLKLSQLVSARTQL